MIIRTSDLAGVGKRISIQTAEGKLVVLIIHHTGKKELFFFKKMDADQADFSLTLTGEESRELAAQLLGITYQPAALDKMKAFRKEIVMEWLEVEKGSPLAGKSIMESQIRTRTGASVIGIIKGDELVASPGVKEVIKEGDTLIAVGKAKQIEALEAICSGGNKGGS